MRVGAVDSYAFAQPYIYNSNALSSKSMRKVDGISSDLLSSKTDFSSLTKEENVNPLKKGETVNFNDVLMQQMYTGQMRASKIMQEG